VRARVTGLIDPDRTVASQQLPALDRARTGTPAIGTRPGLIGRPGLAGGGLFAKPTGEVPAGVVGDLFNRGEVQIRGGAVGPEEFVRERRDKLQETGVFGGIGEWRSKH
jgi:hypothetical protein